MNLRLIIFFLLSSVLYTKSFSQQVGFIKYTVQDGLVANPVRCVYQDSKGFIWIGTFDGLSRYDGYKFTNYTSINGLSHNFINSIVEVNGKLLIAQNNGAVDIIENSGIQNGVKAESAINFVMDSNERILMTTDANGFLEYRNETFVSLSQPNITSALGHFIWINDTLLLSAGVDNNLFLHNKDLSIVATYENSGTHFYSLKRDSKNRIWACTTAGLWLIQITANKNPRLSVAPLPEVFDSPPLNNTAVTSMIEEEDGSFWFGTLRGLVHVFRDGKIYVYNEKDGLPSSMIQTLYLDKEKNLWIGTALGLAKWVSRNSVVYFNTEKEEFRNDVISIMTGPGQPVLLTTDKGLQEFRFDLNEFNNIKVPGDKYATPIVGTSPLLMQYDDHIGTLNIEKNTVVPLMKLDTDIKGVIAAVKHPRGHYFFGSFGGLYMANKGSVKKILPYRITGITLDLNGHLWVGTWREGLYRIDLNEQKEELYDILDMSTIIKEKEIRGLFADSRSNIWVGTRYNGAFCLTPGTNNNYDVKHFNRQAGLMSDWVICFAETKSKDIWVGTYLGLDKLVKQTSNYRVFNFSKTVNFFAEIKKIIFTNDRWLCLANSGIAIFKDENLHQNPPLQPVIFSSTLGVRENRITIYSPVDKINLKPFQNAARFEFGALGFINERQILYSYRLKGRNDTVWSKPENIHEASFASLSPGDYTFEVKTIGWNGEHGSPASFSFYIKTPFWKQWWFMAFIIMGVLGLLYAFYRYRINQLLRLQTVRNNIATDLHDDIGSSLTNISILSELSRKNLIHQEKAQSFLQRISEEVQTSSQAMDDIIWSVNSRNDSLKETMARMRRYAAELFDNSHIECHLQLDENASDKKLTMEQRRDVYLIYKEALNNIHKHAAPNNVWVEVAQNHNHLFIHIRDDGKGFDPNSITHRNGLKNLKSRVEKWNGKIHIGSVTGGGTTIDIKIPLKE